MRSFTYTEGGELSPPKEIKNETVLFTVARETPRNRMLLVAIA
jgi:hypothetical protein